MDDVWREEKSPARTSARRCDGAQTKNLVHGSFRTAQTWKKNLENLSSCETKFLSLTFFVPPTARAHPDQEALHRFASWARW